MNGVHPKQADIYQLKELYAKIGSLVENATDHNAFQILVEIECCMESYRLQQTINGQLLERNYAAQIERVRKEQKKN
ncbi:hypothetical protein [Listeria sp. PSOL-1]|uniref:hypothetical protein n=1 Tax=Listeria sp. PSOL-1 TaxID=1844999 RepID=UPI0013CF55FE|nr:hypothetical protein [Listeria sp. PSOL-1]